MTPLIQSLKESAEGEIDVFRYEYEFESALEEIWSPAEEVFTLYQEPLFEPSEDDDVRFSVSPSPPLEWTIAFTFSFKKAISKVDKNLQGRVLAALTELSENPLTPHGDTRKPLTGDLQGLWRHRVGDYRLVYEADAKKRQVVLLMFAARGGIYD